MNQRILDADKIQEGLRNSGLMWSVKVMSTMNLKTGTSVQLSGNYSSPRILTLGVSAPRYGMDVGVRQSMLKNRASLSLRVSDVFYTSSWIMSLDGNGFSQEIERYFDSRVAFLTFTYQFGQQQRDNSSRRNRGQRDGSDDEGGGEMMF
jgi:iron complex outermembrane recepter protein